MNDKLLTYRYPRTLHEAASRYLCNGEDAQAIDGPHKTHISPDDIVTYFCVVTAAVVAALAIAGVL